MRISAGIFCKVSSGAIALHSGRSVVPAVLLLTMAFLSACATARHVAAPGSAPAASAQAPEASREPRMLSEYEEARGERKECVASWYGREFHGKPTASGENFNMFALTCAHKEYPLGTKVRVTSLENGKDVECIVNDRGPFVPGRDIDLSYAAARKIDLIGPGVALVDVEPVGRYTRYIKEVKYGRLEGSFVTIQTGSFREEGNAIRFKKGLELRYKDIYIMQANIGNVKYYRVRIGKFRDSAEALKLAKDLAQEGYSVLITKYEQQI